jgi:hypothetical protein
MIFNSIDGSTFCLEILGYEFFDNDHDMYASNWLMLRMIAKDPEENVVWNAVEPYMDTYGAYYLGHWFSKIVAGHLVPLTVRTGWIDELDFDVTEITDCVKLKVKCRYHRFVDGHRVLIRSGFDYEIDREEFKAASEQWQADIARFPTRVNHYGSTLFL